MEILRNTMYVINQVSAIIIAMLLFCIVVLMHRMQKQIKEQIKEPMKEQMKSIRTQIRSISEKIDKLSQLNEARFQQSVKESNMSLSKPEENDKPSSMNPEQWHSLILKALDGEAESRDMLRRRVSDGLDTHIINFANMRERLGNNQYAKFADSSSGACLLIPATINGYYHAYPLPNDGNWLTRHIDMFDTLFDIRGDSTDVSAKVTLERPAYMRQKELAGSKPIYEVVEKGLLRCA